MACLGRRRVGVVFDELDLGLDASGDVSIEQTLQVYLCVDSIYSMRRPTMTTPMIAARVKL